MKDKKTTATAPKPAQPVKPIREDLVQALRDYQKAGADGSGAKPFTTVELGLALGFDSSAVTKVFTKAFRGNAERFTRNAEDLLRSATKTRELQTELFETEFTRSIAALFDRIRSTGQMGLAFSPAGLGKSSGIALYKAANPLTLTAIAFNWCGTKDGVMRQLFEQVDTSKWKASDLPRSEYLVSRLKGSKRLLIVDNAHALTASGRQFVFHLHEATGIPVCLVGNPEIKDRIEPNDQQFSRVSLNPPCAAGSATADARQMIRVHWPEAGERILPLAAAIVKNKGHLRVLWSVLVLARDLWASGQFASHAEAFRAANTQQVHKAQLPALAEAA